MKIVSVFTVENRSCLVDFSFSMDFFAIYWFLCERALRLWLPSYWLFWLFFFPFHYLTKHFWLDTFCLFCRLKINKMLSMFDFSYWIKKSVHFLSATQWLSARYWAKRKQLHNSMVLLDAPSLEQHKLEFFNVLVIFWKKKTTFHQHFYRGLNNNHFAPKNERKHKINDTLILVIFCLINWTAVRKISSN